VTRRLVDLGATGLDHRVGGDALARAHHQQVTAPHRRGRHLALDVVLVDDARGRRRQRGQGRQRAGGASPRGGLERVARRDEAEDAEHALGVEAAASAGRRGRSRSPSAAAAPSVTSASIAGAPRTSVRDAGAPDRPARDPGQRRGQRHQPPGQRRRRDRPQPRRDRPRHRGHRSSQRVGHAIMAVRQRRRGDHHAPSSRAS
jgi:hypothetical protein